MGGDIYPLCISLILLFVNLDVHHLISIYVSFIILFNFVFELTYSHMLVYLIPPFFTSKECGGCYPFYFFLLLFSSLLRHTYLCNKFLPVVIKFQSFVTVTAHYHPVVKAITRKSFNEYPKFSVVFYFTQLFGKIPSAGNMFLKFSYGLKCKF